MFLDEDELSLKKNDGNEIIPIRNHELQRVFAYDGTVWRTRAAAAASFIMY